MTASNEKNIDTFLDSFGARVIQLLDSIDTIDVSLGAQAMSDLMSKSDAVETRIDLYRQAGRDITALEKQSRDLGGQIMKGLVTLAISNSSVQRVAALVPLDKIYPNLKADLAAAGLDEISALVEIAEKPGQNASQRPKPPVSNPS